jgi:hypothetical protein
MSDHAGVTWAGCQPAAPAPVPALPESKATPPRTSSPFAAAPLPDISGIRYTAVSMITKDFH